jgi:hypothetical protein
MEIEILYDNETILIESIAIDLNINEYYIELNVENNSKNLLLLNKMLNCYSNNMLSFTKYAQVTILNYNLNYNLYDCILKEYNINQFNIELTLNYRYYKYSELRISQKRLKKLRGLL